MSSGNKINDKITFSNKYNISLSIFNSRYNLEPDLFVIFNLNFPSMSSPESIFKRFNAKENRIKIIEASLPNINAIKMLRNNINVTAI
ncbi:MAG: hypothetical protein LM590_06240 [Thermofilum sp.]|nr:hypothetical protein [Thermofilum sp.]